MREIKFRVWDAKNNKMILPYKGAGMEFIYIGLHGDTYEDGGYDSPSYCHEQEQYLLMQYTGLKDKNGKEIYEGDIVKLYNGYVMEVIWVVLYAGFFVRDKDLSIAGLDAITSPTHYEVIGNIYENPELLNALDDTKGNLHIKGIEKIA